jgi:DNA-binding XRE family transcriptional regulator
MQSMPKEALVDLMQVANELPNCESTDDVREVFETMREILFPESIGTIKAPDAEARPEGLIARSIYIGCRIKEEREKSGITQEDLANAAGLTQSHVSRLETGQHSPAWRTLEKIAEALKIEARQLDPLAE